MLTSGDTGPMTLRTVNFFNLVKSVVSDFDEQANANFIAGFIEPIAFA